MKLELKHLSGYLPYELRIKNSNTEMPLTGYYLDELNDPQFGFDDTFKPILRPLSDLTKEIEVNGEKFVPIDEIAEIEEVVCTYSIEFFETSIKYLPNWITEKLLEWHFDIHGLIENDLAIDKNLC